METLLTTPKPDLAAEVAARFGDAVLAIQPTADGITTVWVRPEGAARVLGHLKNEVASPFKMLLDLTAIDERERGNRAGQPASDFTVVYHLMSLDRNSDVRVKVPLTGSSPAIRSITGLWPCANWYESEAWDMFGIDFAGHPLQRRILSPPWWEGHPLRKDQPARATEMGPFQMPESRAAALDKTMEIRPEEWGLKAGNPDLDYMFLNFGPHHPGTHGVFRIILQMLGQETVDMACDIGYHHRGA